jgi:adenylate cyclase class IV
MMRDHRFDRGGELSLRDEVLRIRMLEAQGGPRRAIIGWKGRTELSPEGYKRRQELECTTEDGAGLVAVLRALGYGTVQVIDRYVEIFALNGAVVRLEWYPRMDVLIEVEGPPAAIESAIQVSGIARQEFLPDSLAAFVARYEARSGMRAVLAEADLHGGIPGWRDA